MAFFSFVCAGKLIICRENPYYAYVQHCKIQRMKHSLGPDVHTTPQLSYIFVKNL